MFRRFSACVIALHFLPRCVRRRFVVVDVVLEARLAFLLFSSPLVTPLFVCILCAAHSSTGLGERSNQHCLFRIV